MTPVSAAEPPEITPQRPLRARRRRWRARAALTVGGVTVALALAACGGNGSLLSSGAATQLTADLSQASSALAQYNCPAAESALSNFANDVSELQGVNATLVSMLSQGAKTITALAEDRCSTATTTTPPRTTTTATDTTTTATDTTTTATDTATTPLTTTSATSTSGGQAPETVTGAATDTVTTASTPTTTPDSGGNGLGSSVASGGTGVGGGDGQ